MPDERATLRRWAAIVHGDRCGRGGVACGAGGCRGDIRSAPRGAPHRQGRRDTTARARRRCSRRDLPGRYHHPPTGRGAVQPPLCDPHGSRRDTCGRPARRYAGRRRVFGELSMVAESAPTATVRASEEVECLLLDRAAATSVLGTEEGVSFVQASLRRGLSQALDTDGYSLIKAIEQADSETAAIAAARELPTGVCALVAAGSDATKVGRVVGSSIDALTRRLLGFAVADLGDAPATWAWLALGSEARFEQALAHRPGPRPRLRSGRSHHEELDPYFAQLAERVTSGLESAGIRAATVTRWPCTPGSDGRWTRGPMRTGPGCQIRAWTGASCRRSRSISGVWTVRSTWNRHCMPWWHRVTRVSPVPPTSHAPRTRPQAAHGVHAEPRRGVQG